VKHCKGIPSQFVVKKKVGKDEEGHTGLGFMLKKGGGGAERRGEKHHGIFLAIVLEPQNSNDILGEKTGGKNLALPVVATTHLRK